MKKNTLVTFIEKYNIGLVESVKIVSDGTTLKTSFISDDKSVAGTVVAKDFPLEKCELSIFDTAKLKSFIKILEDEIQISLNKTDDDKLINIALSDTKLSADFMLSDPSVIPNPPKIKEVKEFDVEIPITDDFIDVFTKSKNSLPDVDSFTLMMNKKTDKLELVIGYSTVNSNRVKMDIKPTAGKDKVTKPISFNSNYFKDILNKNSEAVGAVFKVSAIGIATVTFSTTEFDATYYLIRKELEG